MRVRVSFVVLVGVVACSGGSAPDGGSCTPCGAACVDLATDRLNCGSCGRACEAVQHCADGVCLSGCGPSLRSCGFGASEYCADTQSSITDCGFCGVACAAGQSCVAGMCTGCPAPLVSCGGACVNTVDDPANCGKCGMRCTAGKVCRSRTCVAPQCMVSPHATGGLPHGLSAGDLNGDGKTDLVVLTDTPPSLDVLLSTGAGAFSTLSHRLPDAGGAGFTAVADFDADGRQDVAVLSGTPPQVTLFLGRDGGALVAGPSYPTGRSPDGLWVAELNSDARPDLLIDTFDDDIGVLASAPGGGFSALVAIDAGARLSVRDLAVSDIDGDGKADLVVADNAGIEVLYGDGTGAFARVMVGGSVRVVAAGDLDGDGRPDLAAITNPTPSTARTSILMNRGGRTWAPWTDVAATAFADRIAIADLSNDGKAEVIETSSAFDYTAVLVNDGTGKLAAPIDYLTIGTRVPVIGDFTGDGNPDVAVASPLHGAVTFLAGHGNGQLAGIREYRLLDRDMQLHLGDLDGDGSRELVTLKYESATQRQFGILYNDGFGGLGRPTFVTVASAVEAMRLVDLSGDGVLDIAGTDPAQAMLSVLRNERDGGFAPMTVATTVRAAGLDTADFNGDGRPDLALAGDAVGVVLNTAGGLMSQATVAIAAQGPQCVAAGDFTRDGRADAIVSSGALRLTAGNGAGALTLGGSLDAGFGQRDVKAGDFNGDGALDVASRELNAVLVYMNMGDGGFGAPGVLHTGAAGAIAAGDLTGDGKDELVLLIDRFFSGGPNVARVFYGSSSGLASAATVSLQTYGDQGSLAIADLDGNGRADLAASSGRFHQIFLNLCGP